MNITLSRLGRTEAGGVASLECGDDTIDIIEREDLDACDICRIAAHRLHQAARKFELLALAAEPFKARTQADINRRGDQQG